ncbi:transposase [Roseofilum casamattae]|nr:transposase [Roseofilum casamattae]
MNQEKFKGIYRVPSARLPSWDYSSNGIYFITICTGDRFPFLGEVVNGKMRLSHVGILADVLWYEIKNHAINVELAEFVVMPNHVHGILILDNPNKSNNSHNSHDSRRDKACLVSTTTTNATIGQQRFQNQGKNTISSIVGGYKSAVTKHARRLGFDFFWQSRFHDHIIRNEKSYAQIVEYIINNPRNWQDDCFYGGDRV